MTEPAKRAAIYARSYQLVELPGATNSLQSQIDRCQAYCQKEGYSIAPGQIYYEVREGTIEDSQELDHIRAAATQGLFDVLVIADHTRITRHPILFVRLLEELDRSSVRLAIVER
jgi:DNA invertase Pin-like site-specific DNA recombinase